MADDSSKLVTWFEKGLLFHKLKPDDIATGNALADSFTCYQVGLIFFAAVVSLVFLLRAHVKLEAGEFIGLPIIVLLPVVNAAFFTLMFFALLRLLRVHVSVREVTTVCCFALGGLMPFLSVAAGYFLYTAIQLALSHKDPGLPYLRAAVYQLLVSGQSVASVKGTMWAIMMAQVALTIFYLAGIVKLTSKIAEQRGFRYVAIGLIVAWFADVFAVRMCFSFVFWKLIIQAGAAA
jgi:hypothetical protein